MKDFSTFEFAGEGFPARKGNGQSHKSPSLASAYFLLMASCLQVAGIYL
jgi:hypothetical protein